MMLNKADIQAQRARQLLAVGPGLLWLIIFLVLPLLAIGAISFFSRGDYGQVQWPLTFGNYKRLAGYGPFGFDSLYPAVLARSVLLGAGTAVLCLTMGLPLAFFISGLSQRWKTAALTLVVIPFWTNLLIRTYAWQILFAPDSPLSRLAAACGLIPAEGDLYPGVFAVFVGMICDYLPFMVLPLYASVEKLDWSLAEAAADLGANGINVFRHAIFPQIKAGLIAGAILVFLPATGQFVIPDLLGGAKTMLLGNAIQQQFGSSRDWPFGGAIAMVSLALMLAGLWIFNRRREA
ncbi:MAG TPA: ABC transporter permease [Candidatus Saccharimonadales bacterium]|nr:ABC transporter permease [Candidatus Saccharimonadales bacterium]